MDNILLKPKKKKRGRPRKNPLPVVNENVKSNTPENDEIILEMNVSLDDYRKYYPNESAKYDKKEKERKMKKHANMFVLDEFTDTESVKSFGKNPKVNELLLKITDRDIQIKELKREVNKLKKLITDSGLHNSSNTKAFEYDLNLIDCKTSKKMVIEKTDVACWWCTYEFDTLPCFIPEKHIDNNYHVFGCFCSLNCASAYNFTCLDDYKVWNRYSLLKKMYKDITGESSEILNSPPKEILKKYGGNMSIEEYRKELKLCAREYRLIIPPMTSTIPILEERVIDGKRRKYYNNVNIDSFDGLKLKRSKPLPNSQNTLMHTMGVRLRK